MICGLLDGLTAQLTRSGAVVLPVVTDDGPVLPTRGTVPSGLLRPVSAPVVPTTAELPAPVFGGTPAARVAAAATGEEAGATGEGERTARAFTVLPSGTAERAVVAPVLEG